jgi:hypothetical protein
MYSAVTSVEAREDFTLSVTFENGNSGVLDMKPLLHFGVFKRIQDYDRFKQVRVAFDTIEWDSGVDLDPEFIHENCIRHEAA